MAEPILVPISRTPGRLDNDDPDYEFSPDLYLALALAYDSMAAPAVTRGDDGVDRPDFERMQPRLALSWSEEPGGDWIVRLRPGVMSHAGNEWTADDLVWVFGKIMAQGVMASWRWTGVVGVVGVDALDRYTVRYRLRAPYPTFPSWLLSVSPNMVDSRTIASHATSHDPYAIDWLNAHVAGYGAYDLVAAGADELSFRPRAEYWMGPPPDGDVLVTTWPDRASAIGALEENRPVVAVGLDLDETAAQLRSGRHRVVRTWAGHTSVEIDFAQAPFDDLRVRHAIAFATPYDDVRRRGLLGLARPWTSPSKGISQWYDTRELPFRHDPVRARDLLREAGLGTGLTSRLYVDPGPAAARSAQVLADAWAEVGLEVTLHPIEEFEPGALPPLWLRTECAHNLSEPVYDIVHDYAVLNPLLPLPGGEPHVGGWHPRWRPNPDVLDQLADVLLDPDASAKHDKVLALQRHIVGLSTSVFLAETPQTMVANHLVPPALLDPGSRFYQALQLQNCNSTYLPPRT